MMFLTRPLQFLAVAAGAGSMMLAVLSSTAQAERPTYRSISTAGSTYQTASHGCPCPCPSGDGAVVDPDQVPAPTEGEDLPEVADLTGDSNFASAPQSAVPNAIGDSMGSSGCFLTTISGYGSAPVCTSVRNFRISENNSALPQHRIYYNYNYFNNALRVDDGNNVNDLDVQRNEFGFEYPFWCNMASVGVQVPFAHTLNRDFDTAAPDLYNVEFDNIQVFLKTVLYQDCCQTVSAGLGIDLPTGRDNVFTDGNSVYALDNDVVVLSPYLAFLKSDPCGCAFYQGFAQVDVPTDRYGVDLDGNTGYIDGLTLLHLDGSVGYWLQQDCCGNGIAAIAELHWTTNLSGADRLGPANGTNIASGNFDMLNATVGANIANGCWSIRPAVVVPLLSRPDRAFDWEAALQVNRRF